MASQDDDVIHDSNVIGHQELALQISQVQGMIHELKDGFLLAMQELTKIQDGDQALHEKVETNKTEQENQLKEVVDMVLALKSEFEEVVTQLHDANESQQNLQKQVESLQYERDVLLDELQRAGTSTHTNNRKPPGKKSRPPSLSLESHHSGDSGVNPLGLSDDELSHSGLSPMVKPYIASLRKVHQAHLFEDGYDSDSSLAKTLNLSRSFGQTLKLTHYSSEDESSECGSVDMCSKHSGSSCGRKSMNVTPRIPRRKISSESIDSNYMKTAEKRKHKVPPHERAMSDGQKSRYSKELLESERLFCSALWTLIDVFMEPLKETGFVDNQDLIMLFPRSVHQLYEQHCCILTKLEERMVNSKWQGVIGDIFAWFINKADMDIFGVYRTYLHDLPDAVKTVNRLYADSGTFRRYLKKCQRNPSCKGQDLVHFLLMPVQRIPQYIMILKHLLKLTDSDHPDYFSLESSLDKLRKFLHELNESVEHAMKLVRGDVTADTVVSPRSSTNSVKSSVSSQDGFPATKDSGIHSNGEEVSMPPLSPDANKKTAVSQFKVRNAKLLKEELLKQHKARNKDTSNKNGVVVAEKPENTMESSNSVPKNLNRTKEKPAKVRRSSADSGVSEKTNGAIGKTEPAVRLRKKRLEGRAKTMSNLYPEQSNADIEMPKRNSVDLSPPVNGHATPEENYAANCQTLPTRGKKARKLKMAKSKLAEVEELPCQDRLNLEASATPTANHHPAVNGEAESESSLVDSPRRLSKQKLGMIQKWRSQGDILGEESPEMHQDAPPLHPAKSLTDVALAHELDSQARESINESETGSSQSGEKKKKHRRRRNTDEFDLDNITPPPPPDAFKTKKKTFKDTVKNIFKRSSRIAKTPDELSPSTDDLPRSSPSLEMFPEPSSHGSNFTQFVYDPPVELGPPGGALGYTDSEEEYDEDGEPCSAV